MMQEWAVHDPNWWNYLLHLDENPDYIPPDALYIDEHRPTGPITVITNETTQVTFPTYDPTKGITQIRIGRLWTEVWLSNDHVESLIGSGSIGDLLITAIAFIPGLPAKVISAYFTVYKWRIANVDQGRGIYAKWPTASPPGGLISDVFRMFTMKSQ